jgi:diaminopimelate epimerase
LTYEGNGNDTILIRRVEHLVIDDNKTLTQIIQEALDEYLEKGVIRVENKKRYDFKSNM